MSPFSAVKPVLIEEWKPTTPLIFGAEPRHVQDDSAAETVADRTHLIRVGIFYILYDIEGGIEACFHQRIVKVPILPDMLRASSREISFPSPYISRANATYPSLARSTARLLA